MHAPKPSKELNYRIFVGAFPSGELGERLQAVRRSFDLMTAQITPPHVTLVGTYWHNGPATAENEQKTIERLQSAVSEISPFQLHLNQIHIFPGEKPVIYLGVEITPDLLSARRVLLAALGFDNHPNFTPHLTLAMRLNTLAAARMVTALAQSPWVTQTHIVPISELRLMQRGPQDAAWRCIAALPLQKGSQT
jgi:2'-5' RNA ligase